MKDASVPLTSLWPFSILNAVWSCLSGNGEPRTGHSVRRYVTSVEGGITPLNPQATLYPVQPQRLFAAFATRAYCWRMTDLPSTRTPRTFSANLLPRWLAPACTAAGNYSPPATGLYRSHC